MVTSKTMRKLIYGFWGGTGVVLDILATSTDNEGNLILRKE